MDRNEEDPIAEVDEEDAVVEVDVPSHSDRLPGLAYCLNANPPMWQAVLFGFYHYVLKLGVSCIIIDRLVKVMGGTELGKCLEVGIPMLVLILTISVYIPRLHARRRAIYEHFGPVFSVGIIWVYVVILNYSGAYCKSQTGRSELIKAAPWIRIPYAFQWGNPSFDNGVISIMLAGSIVSVIKSTGAMITIARHAGATHLPPSIISRGIGWQGVDLFLNGIFGTLTGSAASKNV